ncbi:alanine racemase [Kribbella deserti]|uniref:Alanine racemase n=1 Tax=Kribbella deserti TaxID=1926257 RepID=A0ABV6QW98_9ACTN
MNLVEVLPQAGCDGLAEAVIDLAAIQANVHRFQTLRPGLQVMAVVKADGFGHGMVPVARACLAAGATWLGVARAEEALQLREAGITAPVLVWLYGPDDLELLEDVDVSIAGLAELERAAAAPNVQNVQLKLDTGLHRGGSSSGQWIELTEQAARLEAEGRFHVRGLWSHLSHGDEPSGVHNRRQLEMFRAGVVLARRAGLDPEHLHLTNSAGTVALDAPELTLARIGAGLFGIDELGVGLQPAMRLTTRLHQTRRIRAGEGVSYGHDFVAERDTTVGLVPLGYADGIPRGVHATVLIGGVRVPIAGRIAMDQFVVDLGDATAAPGDEVVVFGDGSQGEPTGADWARWAGTIPHEIYCGIGARVPRRYLDPAGSGSSGPVAPGRISPTERQK